MSSATPKGWLEVEFGELFSEPSGNIVDGPFGSNLKATEYVPSGVPIVRLQNIDRNQFVSKNIQYVTPKKAAELARHTFVPGDILITKLGDPLGKACLAPGAIEKGVLVADVVRARLTHGWVDKRFLCYQLNAEQMVQQFKYQTKGTTRPRVNLTKIRSLRARLCPLPEQLRVVEKLEELLSDLDAGVAELKAAQHKLAQYRQSLLQTVVEVSSSGSRYAKVPLGDLVVSIGQGWSPKCEDGAANSGWAVIKTTAIQPLSFDGAHNKKLPSSLRPREHLELKPGDLLVTRAGPRSRVGITCLVRQVREGLILCDKAYRVRCNESKIDPAFLELVLNAPGFVNEIDCLKTGINDSGLNLTQDRFLTLPISLPTLDEQAQIVENFASHNAVIAHQEAAMTKGLQQATAQRNNILKAAFAGQLVPQDPNDEPASELLARIRAERASNDGSAPRRRRKTA